MTDLLSFKFRGDTFYQKETVVPLNQPGLTLFVGNNLDGDVPSGMLSNGTGKTRLIQLLQSFIYGSSDRGTLKNIVTPNFYGTLELRNDHEWSFTFDLKENRWTIIQDGKLYFESHKPSECLELLQKQFPLSKKDWLNYVHISGKSITTLLEGKPADRRKYLESFFDIDDWYALKKAEYDSLCSGLQDDILQLRQKEGQRTQIDTLLSEQESEAFLKMQVEVLDGTIVHLRDQITTVSEEADRHAADIESWIEYQALYDRIEQLPKLKTLRAQHDALALRLAETRERQNRRSALEEFVNDELEPARRVLKPSPPEPTVLNPNAAVLAEREAEIVQIRQKIKLKTKIRELEEALPDIEGFRPLERIESLLVGLRDNLADVKHHRSLLQDGDHCSHCGQTLEFVLRSSSVEVRAAELDAEIQAQEEQIREFDGQIRSLRRHQSLAEQIESLQSEFDAYPKFGVKVSDAEKELEAMRSAAAEWQAWSRQINRQRDAQAAFDSKLAQATGMGYPELLEEVDRSKDIADIRKEVESVTSAISLQEHFERLADNVRKLNTKTAIESALTKLRLVQHETQTSLDGMIDLRGQYRSSLQTLAGLLDTRKQLDKELERKSDLEREFSIVEGLAKFYSPKGFMLYELKSRCQALIEKANYWSPIFFQEQYEWSLSPDMDDLDFFVRPIKHPATQPYPVSMLSAGEENRGARVLLFSQLQITPPNKKLNVLFLDEVERNLDRAGMVAFTETVIPKLKETFPERPIIIISHDPSLQNSPHIDTVWTAERKDRTTTFSVS